MSNSYNEILKRLDLDDLDLQSERIKIFMKPDDSETSHKQSKRKQKRTPVPALDFTKIYEWRE